MRKFYQMSRTFLKKIGGPAENRTREACAGYALRYHSSLLQREIHFPVSTISTTGPEYLTHQVCYYTKAMKDEQQTCGIPTHYSLELGFIQPRHIFIRLLHNNVFTRYVEGITT